MSGGGGKGGSETSTQSLPPWLDAAAQRNVARAEEISKIGYVPKYGPDVAAFAPQQMAAFQNTNDLASAYGMQGGEINTPTSMDYGGGIQGYSSGDAYDQMVGELADRRPAQAAAINNQFINPYGAPAAPAAPARTGTTRRAYSPFGRQSTGHYAPDAGSGNGTGDGG
jgi:hypothetical protein